MTDFSKASRQDMQQKTADKFQCVQGHRLLTVAMCVIPPEKGDLAVFQGQDAVIGNGDPVSIAAQIRDNFFSAAKRRFAVYDPVFPVAGIQ